MRQHQRRAHPEAYNNEDLALIERRKPTTRSQYTTAEIQEIAHIEASIPNRSKLLSKDVNAILSRKSNRTLDGIKKLRQRQDYKNALTIELENKNKNTQQNISATTTQAMDEPVEASANTTGLKEQIQVIANENEACPTNKIDQTQDSCIHIKIKEIVDLLKAIQGKTTDQMKLIINNIIQNAPQEHVINMLNTYILDIAPQNRKSNKYAKKKQYVQRKGNRSKKRAAQHARLQKLFSKNPRQAAEHILCNSSLDDIETPNMNTFTEYYSNIFKHKELNWNLNSKYTSNSINLSYAISSTELDSALRKQKESAPGNDFIKREHLRAMCRADLHALLNIIWGTRYFPPVLRTNRTTLIPKCGNLKDPRQWRPITISSRLLRILNNIITTRLEDEIKISHCQRGFTKSDGLMANNSILQTIIRTRRNEAKPCVILSIDLSKAFDRVTETSIVDALVKCGLDTHTIQYIEESYHNVTTILECHGSRSEPINICRGVKQGDPMSGFLFNVVLDDLIQKLSIRDGLNINGTNVPVLAFADDIVIAASTPAAMRGHIKVIEEFFDKHDFEVNVNKCSALQLISVPGTKRLAVQTKSLLQIKNQPVPTIDVPSQLKYLGLHYTYRGVVSPTPSRIEEMLTRLKKSPLKPWQKMTILQRYLIPRFHHGMQTLDVTKKKLKYIDNCIVRFVKATLHLPKTTPTAYIHAPLKSGGLGIPSLLLHISSIYLHRIEKLTIRGDPITQQIMQTPVMQQLNNKLKRILRNVNLTTKTAVQNYWTEQLHATGLGAGLKAMTSGSSSWIYNPPKYWNGRDYIGAINLRIGLLPTKGAPYMVDCDCRNPSCSGTRETLYHILQRCPVTHYSRINRHDNINKTIKESIQKTGIKCEEAPRINIKSDRYIPDLVAVKDKKAYIIETTVAYESKSHSIKNAYKIKKEKYNTLEVKNKIKTMYSVQEVSVMPIVVGARGSWMVSNDDVVRALNLPKSLRQIICNLSLQWGVSIHKHFMRTVWRTQKRPHDPGGRGRLGRIQKT